MNSQKRHFKPLPLVPNKQPADIEAQIDAPANKESVRQHRRAAVHVAIAIPSRRKKKRFHTVSFLRTAIISFKEILFSVAFTFFCYNYICLISSPKRYRNID